MKPLKTPQITVSRRAALTLPALPFLVSARPSKAFVGTDGRRGAGEGDPRLAGRCRV